MSKEIIEHKTKLREYIKGFVAASFDNSDKERLDTVGDVIYLLYEGAIVNPIFLNMSGLYKGRRRWSKSY